MAGQRESVEAVHGALALLPRGRWLLAVSGGRDSMVLLDAMASARGAELAAVASFDHGTGRAARHACALVEREAERRGVPFVTGVAPAGMPRSEAQWRTARRSFLAGWSRELEAPVVTAHTRDDQIETVVQRLLRGAGARGLAGMLAGGVRPLLTVPRATVAAYAAARAVPYVEDPTNASLEFQRNRVRHELLPALERAQPGFGEWCWAIGERAAVWRAALERVVDTLLAAPPARTTLVVAAAPVAALGAAEWGVLWPALAARLHVVMDRRGIARAAEWAPHATAGEAIPLSGEARIERTATTFVLRGTTRDAPDYIFHQ